MKNSQSFMYSDYSVSLKVFSLGRTRRGAKFELPSAHWLTAGKIDDYAQAARGSTQNRYILKAKQSPPIKTITKEIPMKDLIKTYEQQFGKGFPILTPHVSRLSFIHEFDTSLIDTELSILNTVFKKM